MMQGVEKMLGVNRTGPKLSPELTEEMVAGTQEFVPTSSGDEEEIARVRAEAANESEPVGSIPPPASVKQAVSTVMKALKRERPLVFTDKLGARLAFERTGVRLYDALISKFDIYGTFAGGPTREELEKIREDEFSHFELLTQAILDLGGDPTAVTPSAGVHPVATSGVPKALSDPRTNLVDCLEVILLVELSDRESWEVLMDMAGQAEEQELFAKFAAALATEQEHLAKVREWLAAAMT